jgi:hypothetical protein
MRVEPKELLLGAGLLALIAIGVCRVAGPGRSPMRPVSIEAIEIPTETLGQGQTVTREVSWDPPDDVYLIGWHPTAGAPEAEPEMMLRVGEVRIFDTRGPRPTGAFFPAGAGYLVRKGQRVTLRLTLDNSGPEGPSHGARVLLYFVPVAGN